MGAAIAGPGNDEAPSLARRARHALSTGETRDAAWLALLATEEDPEDGYGWAVLARILHEVTGDALATLVAHAADAMPMAEADRADAGWFLRVDLWNRGLLAAPDDAPVLSADAFDEPERFRPTEQLAGWLVERQARWGPLHQAKRGLRRLIGALSDAYEMPLEVEDPLRDDVPWAPMPEFQQWRAALRPVEAIPPPATDAPGEVRLRSDFWTEREIERREVAGALDAALEEAEAWADDRPGRARPRVAAVRLALALGRAEVAAAREREIVELETEDLAELEEARVGLGLLERFAAQRRILDKMDAVAPGQPVVLANRGAVALELGDHVAAEKDLRLALELEPTNGPALTNLALLRLREADYVAARGLLEEAKRLHPEEAQVRYYLAACLQNQRHPEAAVREAKAAIALDPGFTPARDLLDRLTRA